MTGREQEENSQLFLGFVVFPGEQTEQFQSCLAFHTCDRF